MHSFIFSIKKGAYLRITQQLLGYKNITTTEVYVYLDKSYLK